MILTSFGLFACTTTERINADALLQLRSAPPAGQPVVLETEDGERVRLDPRSKLRFVLKDGRTTYAVRAHEIEITPKGDIRHGNDVWLATDIDEVEVENIDGVKSYFLAVGIVGVAAIVVATTVATKGKGQKSKISAQPAGPKGGTPPRISARPAGSAPRPRAPRGRSRVYVNPFPHVPPRGLYGGYYGRHRAAAVSQTSAAPAVDGPHKLFTNATVRRSEMSFILQTDVGQSFDVRNGASVGVGAGFAFMNLLELGGGVRFQSIEDGTADTMGYLRAGGNFPFSAGDTFGAPLHLELGIDGDGWRQARLAWGIRFRFDQLELALLPLNPQLNRFDDDELYWDFPSSIQLGYRF